MKRTSGEMNFNAGVGVRSITPEKEWIDAGQIYLWGFASRTHSCQGIHSPIYTRALLIQDPEEETMLLVSVDIASLDPELTAEVRKRINQSFSIPSESVCINASHTHGAPVTMSVPTWQEGFDQPFPAYRSFLIEQIVDAVGTAVSDLQPASVWFGKGQTAIGFDRHFKQPSAADRTLDVIKVTDVNGRTCCTAFFASCHPVCMGDYNFVNADFPGVAREQIEAEVGGTAIFFQAYAGTTNPKVLDANLAGQQLAGEVITILDQPLMEVSGGLVSAGLTFFQPFQPFPGDEVLSRARSAGGMFARWAGAMQAARGTHASKLGVELVGFRIGKGSSAWYLAACSHEVSSDLAEPTRSQFEAHIATLLGYSSSVLCYLTSDRVLSTPESCDHFPFCEQNYEGGCLLCLVRSPRAVGSRC